MDSIIGKIIGRYEVNGEIGRGGLAVVYRAKDTVLGRTVALKLLMDQNTEKNERFLRRFQREAKTLAQLSHPSIVKVLDYGDYEGQPYLVMEYISGGTLSSRIGKPMPYTEAATLLAPIARALQHAHQHKVVHRDVKPGNILFNESGQGMLSDFGIVKLTDSDESQSLTGTGSIVGTPSYMAPEQIQGKPVDGRADVYALGIVLFELVSGRKPYTANTPLEVTMKHLTEPVPHVRQIVREVPSEVEQVLLKAMAKKPEARYQDMGVFADALEKLAVGQKAAVRAISKISVSTAVEEVEKKAPEDNKQKGSRKILVAGIITALLVISAIIAYLTGAFQNPMVMGVSNTLSTPTNEETVQLPATSTVTATKERTSPTPADTSTPAPTETFTPIPATPTLTPTQVVGLITTDNVDSIIELSRLEKVSVKDMYWTSDGKKILVGGTSAINIVNPVTMKSEGVINLMNEIPQMIRSTSDNLQVAALLNNTVKYYTINDRKLTKTITFQGGANSMAMSPDDTLIALGMPASKVLLIDTASQSVMRTLNSNPGGWSVAFSPDGRFIAAGTSKGTRLWEVGTGIGQPITTGTNDLIQVVVFSHDSKWLAGAGKNIIRIWDVETMQEIIAIRENVGTIKAMAFTPDDRLLVTGGEDVKLRIWDLNQKKLIRVLEGNKTSIFGVLISQDGRLIISGENNGVVRMFGIP